MEKINKKKLEDLKNIQNLITTKEGFNSPLELHVLSKKSMEIVQQHMKKINFENLNILELGVGTGNLTKLILSNNPLKVIGIEIQENLCKIEHKKLSLVINDLTQVDYSFLKEGEWAIISNPPYSLSPFIKHLINEYSIQKSMLIVGEKRYKTNFEDFNVDHIFKYNFCEPPAPGDHVLISKGFCSKNRDKDTVDMRSGIDSIDSLNYVEETNKSFLATYFMKEELSDLKIHTENKKIPAHSFILMARSPVFKSLLKNNPRVIELEVGHFAVHHFLYFIYTFEYSIPNDTKSRFELLELLSHFEFIDFQKYLIQYIIDNLNEQNMIDVFEKSQKHGIEEIENQSYDFLIGLGDNLLNSDKFLKIKLKNVKKIISDDDLSIDEFTIFKTMKYGMNW
eukprot:gene11340-4508_t